MFVVIRAITKINAIYGVSESEEETVGDLVRNAKLKKQQLQRRRTIEDLEEVSENEQNVLTMPPTPEIFPTEPEGSPQDWYSSAQTTPLLSPHHSSFDEKSEMEQESGSEKFDGSSEGSTYSPPKKKPKKAAKEIVHSKKSKSYEPNQPTSKAHTKKAGKGQKHSFTVDGTWSGDERDGLPTVDPRQGKKFTRAGRKKSGRKTRQTSTRGRRANRQLSLQEEVDTPVLFDIPENARVLPTRAQLKAAAEAGYAGDLPADFPDVDEEVLPTDLVGEE